MFAREAAGVAGLARSVEDGAGAGVGVAYEAALAAGEIVVAVLAVTSGGGWAAAGEEAERGEGAGSVFLVQSFGYGRPCDPAGTSSSSSSSLTCPDSVHRQSVDLPVLWQRRVPTVQTVQPTAEIL